VALLPIYAIAPQSLGGLARGVHVLPAALPGGVVLGAAARDDEHNKQSTTGNRRLVILVNAGGQPGGTCDQKHSRCVLAAGPRTPRDVEVRVPTPAGGF
jgi:hypothetical protein